jgi:hypothetical protein
MSIEFKKNNEEREEKQCRFEDCFWKKYGPTYNLIIINSFKDYYTITVSNLLSKLWCYSLWTYFLGTSFFSYFI